MLSLSPDHIAGLLAGKLPGRESHLKMMPLGRNLPVDGYAGTDARHSSVLLLLFVQEGQVCTSLIKRSSSVRTHPGQVSLPGGRIENGESPEFAALRETQEEIGISPSDVRLLGRLSELFVQVSKYTIFPYVGWMERKPEFVLNRNEVEKLILFPVQKFQQDRQIQYAPLNTSYGMATVPYYDCSDEMVWGATAMIITEFLDVISGNKSLLVNVC